MKKNYNLFKNYILEDIEERLFRYSESILQYI